MNYKTLLLTAVIALTACISSSFGNTNTANEGQMDNCSVFFNTTVLSGAIEVVVDDFHPPFTIGWDGPGSTGNIRIEDDRYVIPNLTPGEYVIIVTNKLGCYSRTVAGMSTGMLGTIDQDRDGFTNDVDCDDNDSSVNPGTAEYPNNSVDENCDGIVLVIDNDNDGFHSGVDCDDNNAAINLHAIDIPDNGIDENCDGADASLCDFSPSEVFTTTGATNIFICSGDGIADIIGISTNSTSLANRAYVMVNDQGIIVGILADRIDLEGSPAERCNIYAVFYVGNLLLKAGDVFAGSAISDGCHSTSSNSILVIIEDISTCGQMEDQRIGHSNNQVNVFPNPTQHSLNINLNAYWGQEGYLKLYNTCLLYTSPSPRDATLSRMPSSA